LRIRVSLESERDISLPLSYSYPLQSAIYKILSNVISESHDFGLSVNGRILRPFTFSRLFGHKQRINEGSISLTSPIFLHFSSPLEDFVQAFANSLIKNRGIQLLGTTLELRSIEVEPKIPEASSISARTISPITVYSTLMTADGRKKTYFYNPVEKDFAIQIRENLNRKASALGNDARAGESFSFRLASRPVQRIVKYKDFTQIAWDFRFELQAYPELISIAYDWGLGSKNAQGFGMIKTIERR